MTSCVPVVHNLMNNVLEMPKKVRGFMDDDSDDDDFVTTAKPKCKRTAGDSDDDFAPKKQKKRKKEEAPWKTSTQVKPDSVAMTGITSNQVEAHAWHAVGFGKFSKGKNVEYNRNHAIYGTLYSWHSCIHKHFHGPKSMSRCPITILPVTQSVGSTSQTHIFTLLQ